MPALKMSYTQERQVRAAACFERYQVLRGYSDTDMAKRLGVTKATIQNRKKHPEKMQLEDIWETARILSCPIGELAGGDLPEETLGRLLKAAMER